MPDTLTLISQLEASIPSMPTDLTIAEAEAWWPIVTQIEASLDFDPRYSKAEKEAIVQLKSAVSDAIATVRKDREPLTSRIRVSLLGLRQSVERRTTGIDGWPLRP